jgi:hypothetical protein
MAARDSQLAGFFLPYFIVFACGAPKEDIKEHTTSRNLSATATRVLHAQLQLLGNIFDLHTSPHLTSHLVLLKI